MSEREGDEMGRRKTYPGLRSHRGRDGRLYYYTDTRIGGHGEQGRRIYARHGALEFEEAVRLHKELTETEWRWKHGLGSPEPEKDRPALTFAQAGELWLKALEAAGRDPKSIVAYRRDLNYAGRFLSSIPVDEIELHHIEAMRVGLKNGVGPDGQQISQLAFRTRKNAEHAASMMLRFAAHPNRMWASSNPFDAMVSEKPPKGSQRRHDDRFRHLSPREDRKLLDAIEGEWRRAAISIGLYLGVRASAVVSMRIDDINFANSSICVASEFNKGQAQGLRDDQWLPIPKRLLPVLMRQFNVANSLSSPWLFPTGVVKGRKSQTGHIFPGKLREIVVRAAKKIGYMKGVTFHSLRAVCNNRLRASGIADALSTAARGARGVLGHTSEQSARPYINADIEHLRPVMEAYDRWLDQMSIVNANVVEMR